MKFGSSRWGNDFETKVRAFITKYGFEIIAENETIKCTIKRHNKPSHEIDVVADFSSSGYPMPPIYAPNIGEKFLISSKGGLQVTQADLDSVNNQLECIQNTPEFKDVKKAVIICEHSSFDYPNNGNLYVWDEKYMHLLAMKMRVHRVIKNNPGFRDYQNKDHGVSLMSTMSSSKNLFTQKDETSIQLYFFNENPNKKLGKKELMFLITPFTKPDASGFHSLNKQIYLYSTSGFMTDLLSLTGKNMPENRNVFISSLSDLSIATWVPSLENDFIF